MFEYFKNKKIMIIVPHQDDELNIVGGLLVSNYFNPNNIYIVFMTNGDYLCNYNARIKEVLKISKKLKIPFENFIFLGYPDQHIKEQNHIYQVSSPNIFVSKKGNNETFSNNMFEDYHFQTTKKHAKFNYENLLNDFVDLISNYIPDVLFTVDFDSHPDHRANCLIFDKAMGIILKKIKNYNPLVYKAFSYPTAYKSFNDFNNINFLSTKFNQEDFSISTFQNPYYNWNERIRFPVKTNNFLISNKLYKLLKIYRSQMIIKRAFLIINSDMVFWQRRTDNLCLNAVIETSSGNGSYLNDFMLFDVEKLTEGHSTLPILKNVGWIPEKNDKKKEIIIKLFKNENINKIIFYQNFYDNSRITDILLELSNGYNYEYKLKELKQEIIIPRNNKDIEWVKIKILKSKGNYAGFSEIEIFSNKNNLFEYVDIDGLDSFSQKKLYNKNLNINNFKFYYYNGYESTYINNSDVFLNGKNFRINNIHFGKNYVTIKNIDNLNKEFNLIKINTFWIFIFNIKYLINKIILKKDIFISRVFNKIDRLLKKI